MEKLFVYDNKFAISHLVIYTHLRYCNDNYKVLYDVSVCAHVCVLIYYHHYYYNLDYNNYYNYI